jgi:hypothetical protein
VNKTTTRYKLTPDEQRLIDEVELEEARVKKRAKPTAWKSFKKWAKESKEGLFLVGAFTAFVSGLTYFFGTFVLMVTLTILAGISSLIGLIIWIDKHDR